jgi:hypothetical protein
LRKEREAFLRSHSIDVGQRRLRQLRRRERERFAAVLVTATGRTFRSDAAGFEGRVRVCDPLPNGNRYAEISDRTQFCLVAADTHVRSLDGQRVSVSLEGRKLVVQPRKLDRKLE